MNATGRAKASGTRKDAILDSRIEVNGAFVSRRDFILRTLASGGRVEVTPFTWKGAKMVRKPEYRLYTTDHEHHVITKTEYDFARTLISHE